MWGLQNIRDSDMCCAREGIFCETYHWYTLEYMGFVNVYEVDAAM